MSEDAQDVVLIVEDDPSILMVLSAYLAGEGYRVLQAENGEQALALVHAQPFDLVLSDQAMPVMDGWALLRHLRERWPQLPVLLYSSAPPRRPEGYPQTLHFDASLLKPASGNELIAGIQALMNPLPTERQSSVNEY